VIENVVTHPTTVGWGSRRVLAHALDVLGGDCYKVLLRRLNGRPPYASMKGADFIVGEKPTSSTSS